VTAPQLALAGVTVRHDGRDVVGDVTVTVAPGERLALVGPSGTGKTSLLRAIAGLDAIAAGRVRIAGHDVTTLPPERRRAVYLHQEPVLLGLRTVRDEVAFAAIVRGMPRAAAHAAADALLERVRAPALAGRDPRTLSGGERQRVVLARALAAEPAVLLLDEPFGALDPSLRPVVRDAVSAALAGLTVAVVLVTHDVDEAAAMGDRMGVLLDGALAQCDTPAAVLARPASLAVARLLGHATEIAATVDASGCALTPFGAVPTSLAPGPAIAVARPDAGRARRDASGDAVVTAVLARTGGTLLRVSRDGATATVLADGDVPNLGDRVHVAIDPSRLHVVPDDGGRRVG
jgi:ABC-type sulfate/molybdate transport systems ATPase subunit